MRAWLCSFLLLGFAVCGAPAVADDLGGAGVLLCAAHTATVCERGGDCVSGTAESWNVPQFIVVDINGKRLRTTTASGENRSTPVSDLRQVDRRIFLQGIEMGRAFSIQIDQQTGHLSAAVARDGLVVAVFGSCTPATSDR
jgi:hypothetical protein